MDRLLHYGIPRKSGRYPWGSGEDPYQGLNGYKFLKDYDNLKAKGMSEKDIAAKMGMNTTQLRNNITWANSEKRKFLYDQVTTMNEAGMSGVMIAEKLGISEGSVRNYLKSTEKPQKIQLDNVEKAIKDGAEKTGYLDVGVGVERQLGVSRTQFNAAVNKLVEDGEYTIHQIYVKNLNNPNSPDGKANYTTVKVLTKEKDLEVVKSNSDKIRGLNTFSDDNAMTLTKLTAPQMVKLDRIKIRYAEEGGADKDGLIEMKRGVDDLDLGGSNYAQVRIAAEGNLYLKGMAAYSDDKFPKGVDLIFNTNKEKGTPVDKVLKKMSDDPENPFGANIVKQKGALNIVNEQGDWDKWSGKMSSQFLSKQSTTLIKDRLDATYDSIKKEYDEINSLTNPVVKKYLLGSDGGFIDGLDSKARNLKAQGLKGTKSHVLLPITDLKPNEIYAPNYKNGDRVVLVRHPHGGIFEIPELVVNNRGSKIAKAMIGPNARDAVGIHPSVAGKLSGADFDGDTALVIPNRNGAIKTSRSLKELANFDPQSYKVGKGHPAVDPKTGKTITDRHKQTQMGLVSNLITDMTIKGATQGELARAVKHSMVVIDSEKHNLDWKKSAEDNGINALRRKYQSTVNPDTGKKTLGASTLISRSKNKVNISDPHFDPDRLSSGTAQEKLYSGYIKKLQALKNTAIKSNDSIKIPPYSKEAAKAYAPEVQSLNKKLNTALLNAPRERQAQILTNKIYYSKVTPEMSKDDKKKLRSRALAAARVATGAKKESIKISDREWEAIQSSAISTTKLVQILNNADMDRVKKLATPRPSGMSASKVSRARTMLSNGYTYAEVAEALGVSTSTISQELGN